ncbi:hypothetical protein Gbem_4151 [Citrifermentans bemidjiense Bem]|uniref:Uncharacterized protein n=1 Tax=Citrifermentans bemidjiense (strain ATCC BAA-1014 / DSM 16622 / JCM 12645 / Bem) TaxID=404380 RepID=E1P681_CITBB|nr:hypothetical protein Gbem_4151 [Citrifermentans bemidjiense Bem]
MVSREHAHRHHLQSFPPTDMCKGFSAVKRQLYFWGKGPVISFTGPFFVSTPHRDMPRLPRLKPGQLVRYLRKGPGSWADRGAPSERSIDLGMKFRAAKCGV